ncbi:hypothetical protein [Pusillimonas sp. NJUB218]|uniref:hypothetical protein n=1 Tax=Pusillimonas sp. NJUB218 TaxID=2023230 RepID=UPI000F4CC43E|nr:hypothetical protein [Pusillimonas sp. NJUB218]ROT44307.1 hypothetical protein CHR62_13395 [Pusillimonas sp. NJUB218]
MYTITLQDPPSDIPERTLNDAQNRFQKTLERALGGPENVIAAYRAWQTAEETSETEMSDEDIAMAKKWLVAASRARNDGLRDLGETEAWFEVKLVR